ncbi:MAG: glycosyltransferase family 2 protein [Candidatus Ratteibacteria bacterium]|nr:glycosyltransferase family 2 protein [Candidatus Ratteibacteria bacterium]
MEEKAAVSALIITYNAERFIRGCLESVKGWVNEIILVDMFSSDRTIEIARQYTDRIIQSEEESHELRANMGIEQAASEWILKVNATERIPPPLKDEILQAVNSHDEYSGYYIPRNNFCTCAFMVERPGVLYLFKKAAGRYSDTRAHAPIELKGKAGYLKNFNIHWASLSMEEGIRKLNAYTSRDARKVFNGNPKAFWWRRPVYRVNAFNLLYRTAAGFYMYYFQAKFYRYGLHGLIESIGGAFVFFAEMAKLWELQYKRDHNIKDELLPLDKNYE